MSRRTWIGAGAVLLVISGVWLGAALADRRSTAPPLVYTGVVFDGDAPIADGDHSIGLAVFADASGGTASCTIAPASIPTQLGRFSLPVNDAQCGAAIQHEEQLYVELSVDGTTFPRARIGAVPFAVRAERTVLYSGDRPITSGVYCGMSAETIGRIRSDASTLGWAAAAAMCATACGSPSAHMCSIEELMRDWQAGRNDLPVAWVAAGASTSPPGSGVSVTDCSGWTQGTTGYGFVALPASPPGMENPSVGPQGCDTARPILCCD